MNVFACIYQNCKRKTSTEHGNLSVKLLKGLTSSISEPLTLIINQSLTTGIFPNKLQKWYHYSRKAMKQFLKITALFLYCLSYQLFFEKVVYIQLNEYFVSKSLFYKSQHGFKKLDSTKIASLEFIDQTIKINDAGKLSIFILIYPTLLTLWTTTCFYTDLITKV